MFLLLAACNGGGPGAGTTDTDIVSATLIGPEGGTALSADGRLTLEIPAGALSEEVEITIAEQASEGPLGIEWEMGPDGLEFATPARATIVMDLADTDILQEDGGYVIPNLVSVSGETVERLDQVDILLAEELVISADVEHFSWVGTEDGSAEVDLIFFPQASGSGYARFSVPVGASVSTALRVRGVSAIAGGSVEVDGAAELIGTTRPARSTGPSEFAVNRARLSCVEEGAAQVAHTLSLDDGAVNVRLEAEGLCSIGEERVDLEDLEAGRTLALDESGDVLYVTETGLSRVDLSTRFIEELVETEVPPADAASVGGEVVYLEGGQVIALSEDDPDARTVIYSAPEDTVVRSVDRVGGRLRIVVESPEGTFVYLYRVDAGETYTEDFLGEIDGASEAIRVGDRSGVLAGQPGGELGAIDSPYGAFIELDEGSIEGSLWGGPLQEPLFGGTFDDMDAIEPGTPTRVNGQPFLPFTCVVDDGSACLGVATFIRGELMLGTQPLPDCDNPAGAVCAPDGRCWTACDDGSLQATEPFVEQDLELLEDCDDDLYELQDPRIPLVASGVTMQIGNSDRTDTFQETFTVPEDCLTPRIVVSINGFDEEPDFSLELDTLADGTWVSEIDVSPGEVSVEATLTQDGACVEYSIAGRLECAQPADANEDDDEDYKAGEIGDGEQIVGLSIDPKDPDWFFLDVAGECEVEVQITDEEEGLDVNPFFIAGHGELAYTELGNVRGGLPGTQSLSFSGVGPLYIQVESLFAGVESYDIAVEADCPFDCYEDVFEPNDSLEARDAYDEKSVGSSPWGDTMTVSDSDHDWWEVPVAIFGCYVDSDVPMDITLLDGDPDATLHLSLSDKYGNTWIEDMEITESGLVTATDVLGPYPYSTELYFEWWAEGGCLEFEVEYDIACE